MSVSEERRRPQGVYGTRGMMQACRGAGVWVGKLKAAVGGLGDGEDGTHTHRHTHAHFSVPV